MLSRSQRGFLTIGLDCIPVHTPLHSRSHAGPSLDACASASGTSSPCVLSHPRPPPLVLALALLTVARPRARPTPRPLVPRDRNMGAFLESVSLSVTVFKRVAVPQHIWHDEVPDVTSTNVDLFEMRDTAVACGNGDVLQLHVHVVFGYLVVSACVK